MICQKKKEDKVYPVLNQLLCHEDIWGSGGIAPPFLTSTVDEGELLAT
jgi:hypothetical protein